MRNNRGQFMPLAMIVTLAATVFLVGVVNVYRVAKAKIRAQNLADAAALYVARNMTQSVNVVTDRNEWMNHLYVNSGSTAQSQAGNNPCDRPNPKNTPPGLGCFIAGGPSPSWQGVQYKFHAPDSAKAYARLIQTINQIQELFAASYDGFIGASQANAQNSQGAGVFLQNLRRDIPDFQNDGNVSLAVYNTRSGRDTAEGKVTQNLSRAPTNGAGQTPVIETSGIEKMEYETVDVKVTYRKPGVPPKDVTETLAQILGSPKPIGYMRLKPAANANKRLGTNQAYGAGAVVGIRVSILGWGNYTVKARATAYVMSKSGTLDVDKTKGERLAPPSWFG